MAIRSENCENIEIISHRVRGEIGGLYGWFYDIIGEMKNLEKELSLEYIRASGPGGQNVNKVSTAVQLRFDVTRSNSLAAEVKTRLIKLAGKRMTNEGVLVLEAHKYRTQDRNREEVIQRFYELLRRANEKPKVRKKTKPTKASAEKRLNQKKQRGELKSSRKSNYD